MRRRTTWRTEGSKFRAQQRDSSTGTKAGKFGAIDSARLDGWLKMFPQTEVKSFQLKRTWYKLLE